MFRFFVITFIFVSVNCCGPILTYVGRAVLCNASMNPYAEASNATITTCISEQTGLMSTIERLSNPDSGWDAVLITGLLESNGYATEATGLRKCFARENGMLNADGTYNLDLLKANILSKIGNNECLANTKIGLQQCPAVVKYDVAKYVKCVINYCVNGALAG